MSFRIGDTRFKVVGDRLIVSRGKHIEISLWAPLTMGGLAIKCNTLAKLPDHKLKELK